MPIFSIALAITESFCSFKLFHRLVKTSPIISIAFLPSELLAIGINPSKNRLTDPNTPLADSSTLPSNILNISLISVRTCSITPLAPGTFSSKAVRNLSHAPLNVSTIPPQIFDMFPGISVKNPVIPEAASDAPVSNPIKNPAKVENIGSSTKATPPKISPKVGNFSLTLPIKLLTFVSISVNILDKLKSGLVK